MDDRPSSAGLTRDELLAELNEEGRRHSTGVVLFHAAMAERLSLNVTDHKCLGIIAYEGPMSAGALAEATGLTTGAITGIVDRLERGGFVRRERDPRDRRRVILHAVPERLAHVSELFEPLASGWRRYCERFTDDELAFILSFLADGRAFMAEQARLLRSAAREASSDEQPDAV